MSSRYAVILVKNPENPSEYLFGTRRDNGKVNFPAGGINEKEDPKAGAARELREETGFTAKNLKLASCIRKKDKEGKPIVVYTYTSEIEGSPNLQNDPDMEFQSLYWQDPSTIKNEDLHIPESENSGLKTLKTLIKR